MCVCVCVCVCICVCACRCGCKIQSSHYPCYPVLWSTLCMNTPTPTSPFLSHPHPLFTDGGRRIHIDYTDFLKSAPLHYADNTCLTGRKHSCIKICQYPKAHNLSCSGTFWNFFFFPLPALQGRGGEIETVHLPRGNIFQFYHLCWQRCAAFYFHFPTGQGHLHHLHFMELFLRRRFWFVLMCVYMPLCFFSDTPWIFSTNPG